MKINGDLTLKKALESALRVAAPPSDMNVREWADKYRYLSSESSAESGKYYSDRAPYQREMMEAFSDPSVEEVIFMTSAQVGKSLCQENVIGYFIDQDPSPILVMLPDEKVAKKWSKTKLKPLLRDTPRLRNKVTDSRSGGSDEILFKQFPGGYIAIVGSNSAAGLAMLPIRVVLVDEEDRCSDDAGGEGDPVTLAKKRTKTFWNRKIGRASTPTIKGQSKIEAAFEKSDKRYWFAKCPDCEHEQRLLWKDENNDYRVRFEKDDNGLLIPESVYYVCCECGSLWDDVKRWRAVNDGRWIATAPFRGIAGFHISELYSPWTNLRETVAAFLEAKDDPRKLQTWVNTALGEVFEDRGVRLDDDKLFNRRESYGLDGPEVPDGVLVLTCAVDTQDNRLEAEVKGWGIGEECWGIAYKTFHGDPSESKVWEALEDFLYSKFTHRSGLKFQISCAVIDSGGHHTQMVYDFCKNQSPKAIFAIKGVGGEGIPILSASLNKRSGKDQRKVELYNIGVDEVKGRIASRLSRTAPGPGYFHFPSTYTEEYFKQLAAEELKVKDGKRTWEKIRPRNEAWDITVYNYAALQLVDPTWETLKERIEAAIRNEKPPAKQKQQYQGRRIRHEGIQI